MTVKELCEILSSYNDDVDVYIHIDDIVDNGGYFVSSTAPIEHIVDGDEFGISYGIVICGTE